MSGRVGGESLMRGSLLLQSVQGGQISISLVRAGEKHLNEHQQQGREEVSHVVQKVCLALPEALKGDHPSLLHQAHRPDVGLGLLDFGLVLGMVTRAPDKHLQMTKPLRRSAGY